MGNSKAGGEPPWGKLSFWESCPELNYLEGLAQGEFYFVTLLRQSTSSLFSFYPSSSLGFYFYQTNQFFLSKLTLLTNKFYISPSVFSFLHRHFHSILRSVLRTFLNQHTNTVLASLFMSKAIKLLLSMFNLKFLLYKETVYYHSIGV